MKRLTDTIKTSLVVLIMIWTLATRSFADISNRCNESEDPEYTTLFKAAYFELTGGTNFGNGPINVLDCGYLLIIETPLPPRAFGSNTAYVFRKESFQFISAILFD